MTQPTTKQAYYVTNWHEDRENGETRKYVDLLWFRNKVKLMGEGLGHTLAQPRGPHLYGMFKLIEQVAAGGRLEQRGWLFRNGSPMDAQRIANLLRLPVPDVEEALKFFSTPPMNWLELRDYAGDSPAIPAASAPDGRLPGDSPAKKPQSAGSRDKGGRNSASEEHPNQPTDLERPKNLPEREKNGGKLSAGDLHGQQKAQFAAAREELSRLQAIPEDERSEAENAELKKTRELVKAIQKKQRAGDFTPVEEKKK